MGAPLGSERGACGGVSESGFLEQQATGIGGSGGSWRPGREGSPARGFPGAGIPLPGSPDAGAGPGAPQTRPPGCP